ncbi:type IV secretion protein Rhs, partial [Xanthomonas oryzae]
MDPVATVLSALSAAPHQQERLLRLHTPLGPDVLVAETLDGRESVDGGGFRFDVGALSANAGLPLDDLLGQPVLLELLTAES